jgi:hypothetical protein
MAKKKSTLASELKEARERRRVRRAKSVADSPHRDRVAMAKKVVRSKVKDSQEDSDRIKRTAKDAGLDMSRRTFRGRDDLKKMDVQKKLTDEAKKRKRLRKLLK